MNFFSLGILGIVFSATFTFAADCTEQFSWLPNAENNITEYNIHYGLTDGGPYPNAVSIVNPAPVDGRIWGEVPGLVCDEHYYFVCTAFNDDGLESAFSSQVDFIVSAPAVEPPPVEPPPVTGTFTKVFGSATGADYLGTIQDTFINLNADTSSTLEYLNTYTWPENMAANAIVMKIDLSQLPENAQIQNASLQLYAYEAGGDNIYTIFAHNIINKNPILSASTGYSYDGINDWTANSSCYDNIPLAQADINAAATVNNVDMSTGYKSWDITEMVRNWQAAPGTNYGLLLNSDKVAAANSYRFFASTEASNTNQRPRLVVTYTVNATEISTPTGFKLLN